MIVQARRVPIRLHAFSCLALATSCSWPRLPAPAPSHISSHRADHRRRRLGPHEQLQPSSSSAPWVFSAQAPFGRPTILELLYPPNEDAAARTHLALAYQPSPSGLRFEDCVCLCGCIHRYHIMRPTLPSAVPLPCHRACFPAHNPPRCRPSRLSPSNDAVFRGTRIIRRLVPDKEPRKGRCDQ